MGLYLFSGPAFEFPTHFGDDVSDSEGEALLDSLFCPIVRHCNFLLRNDGNNQQVENVLKRLTTSPFLLKIRLNRLWLYNI